MCSDEEGMYAESQMVTYEREGLKLPFGSRALPTRASPMSEGSTTTRGAFEGLEKQLGAMPAPPPSTRRLDKVIAGSTPSQQRVFQLSGFTMLAKKENIQKVRKLGGRVSPRTEWDPLVTHLVVKEPKKVEKMLAACARGRWVLNSSYLDASVAAGGWVEVRLCPAAGAIMVFTRFMCPRRQEIAHELRTQVPEPMPDDLARAPKRCRLLVQSDPKLSCGVFTGMRALVAMSDTKKSGIVERVIRAGGATVAVAKACPPPATELEEFTVCFVDSRDIALASNTVQKYTSDDIAALLCTGVMAEATSDAVSEQTVGKEGLKRKEPSS
jgi:hypothetical protein